MGRSDSQLLDRMIFLVGARRSGTNWLQRTIGAHPDIAIIPTETYLFSDGIAPLASRFQHGTPTSISLAVTYMERNAFLDGLRDFCDRAFLGLLATLKPSATRLCERTPEHAKHLRLIGDIYPDARFLHIIRDGRDTARSLANQEWGPGSIRVAAEEWVECVTAARSEGKQLRHYHEVRYEELLADPRPHVTQLFEWLDVDASAPAVEAALTEAGVSWNVDPGAPTVGVGKWRESFSSADLEEFLAVGGSLLAELGYADSSVAANASPTPPARAAEPARPRLRGRAPKELVQAVLRRAGLSRARPFPLELRARYREVQQVIDQVLTAIGAARFDDIRALASDTASYRVVDARQDRQARGDDGFRLFADVVRNDAALQGTQRRGDVQIGVPTGSVVLSYQSDDGRTHDRVLVVSYEGGELTRLSWYQHPLGT